MIPLQKIEQEINRQKDLWGEQNHDSLKWFAILGEEFGEIAESVTKTEVPPVDPTRKQEYLENLEVEIIQTAAVCASWLECIERNKNE